MKLFGFFTITLLLFGALQTNAATRKGSFALRATNQVLAFGVTTDRRSVCTINIYNNSNVTQTVNVTTSANTGTTGSGTGIGTAAPTLDGNLGTDINVDPGDTQSFTITFDAVTSAAANATQTVICAGAIVVSDPGTTPGYILASVTLTHFSESDQAASQLASDVIRGASQVLTYEKQVQVNGGKPF